MDRGYRGSDSGGVVKKYKVFLLCALSCIGLVLVWVCLRIALQKEQQREEGELRQRRAEWSRKYSSELHREAVSEGEAKALKGLYAEIACAYTNVQPGVMLDCIGALSNRVRNIPDNLFTEMERLVYVPFVHGFCEMRSLEAFHDAEAFERYAAVNCEMAKFISRMCFQRKDYWDAHLLIVECQTFAKLRKYAEVFDREGRSGLAEVANRYLGSWVDFIESDEGISRVLARNQYEQHMALNVREERQVITHEHATRLARAMAEPLKKKGYTPKWVDAEFPAAPSE